MSNIPTPSQSYPVALMQARDPQSVQLANLMRALGQQPLTSPAQLGSNLLADALLQYGYKRRQQALQASLPVQTNNGAGAAASGSTSTPDPLTRPPSLSPGLNQTQPV